MLKKFDVRFTVVDPREFKCTIREYLAQAVVNPLLETPESSIDWYLDPWRMASDMDLGLPVHD